MGTLAAGGPAGVLRPLALSGRRDSKRCLLRRLRSLGCVLSCSCAAALLMQPLRLLLCALLGCLAAASARQLAQAPTAEPLSSDGHLAGSLAGAGEPLGRCKQG